MATKQTNLCEENVKTQDLLYLPVISSMILHSKLKRPTTQAILFSSIFWSPTKTIDFFQNIKLLCRTSEGKDRIRFLSNCLDETSMVQWKNDVPESFMHLLSDSLFAIRDALDSLIEAILLICDHSTAVDAYTVLLSRFPYLLEILRISFQDLKYAPGLRQFYEDAGESIRFSKHLLQKFPGLKNIKEQIGNLEKNLI